MAATSEDFRLSSLSPSYRHPLLIRDRTLTIITVVLAAFVLMLLFMLYVCYALVIRLCLMQICIIHHAHCTVVYVVAVVKFGRIMLCVVQLYTALNGLK